MVGAGPSGGAGLGAVAVRGPFGPFDALAERAHRLYLDGFGEEAIRACREGLALCEAAGEERTARYLQFVCGVALHQLGRPAEASEEAGHLLARLGEDADPVWRAKALALLAESRVDLGMTALAMDHLAEGQMIVSAQPIRGYDHLSATMSVALALNALALFEPADELMQQMLALRFPPPRVQLNVAQEAAVLRVAWGAVLQVVGRDDDARPHLLEALSRVARMRALARAVDYPEMAARAEVLEGFVLQRLGEPGLAAARLRPAAAAFRLREELAETQVARIGLGVAAADAGDHAAAREALAAVERVSNSTQFDVWQLVALSAAARNAVLDQGPHAAVDALQELARISLARLWEDRESRFETLADRVRQREMAAQQRRQGRDELTDPLTGVGNRRRLQQELERPDRRFSAVLVDLDRFRGLNDEHGRDAGDEVLRRTAGIVLACTGPGDVVVRYGGNAFVVLVPATSRGADAAGVAADVLEAVRREPWPEVAVGLRVTASAGVAGPAPAAEALAAADAARADAKRAGRDRVVAARHRGEAGAATR